MFRKNVPAIEEWSLENVEMCAKRQKEILENGARTVAGGGYLLYSTCTYSTAENEEVVLDFLRRHKDFSIVPCSDELLPFTADGIDINENKNCSISKCRRFYPHRAAAAIQQNASRGCGHGGGGSHRRREPLSLHDGADLA